MIHVVATVALSPGSQERFLAEFRRNAVLVRAESGCLEYFATADVASGLARQGPIRADVVTILERWADLEALAAHATAAHMLTYRQRVAELVASASLQVLEEL